MQCTLYLENRYVYYYGIVLIPTTPTLFYILCNTNIITRTNINNKNNNKLNIISNESVLNKNLDKNI